MGVFDIKAIGKRIRQVRGKTSYAEFALPFEMHGQTISRYEKGKNAPDANFLKKLCDDFNVNPSWLLLGEGPMHPGDQGAAPLEPPPPDVITSSQDDIDQALDPALAIDDKMGLGPAVELLAKIFNSGNHILTRAIIANLQAFGEAIDNKEKEQQARAEREQLRERTTALERQVGELLTELKGRKEKGTIKTNGAQDKASNG